MTLTATDEFSSTDSIRLRIEVLAELPDISGMPCWILWNENVGYIDFEKKGYVKNADKIKWNRSSDIQPVEEKSSDGKKVKFEHPKLSAAEKQLITYTASNSDGLQSRDGSFTIVVLPSEWDCEKDGETLNLISDIDCPVGKLKLQWILQPIPNGPTIDGFEFKCKEVGGNVTIKAQDVEKRYPPHSVDINVEVKNSIAAPAIRKSRFAAEKGFFIENGSLMLKLKENSLVEVNLADKVEYAAESIEAPSLFPSEKITWASQRSEHVDVRIDNKKQTATFISDANWNSNNLEFPEIIQLTATDETGNSDTVFILTWGNMIKL